jgi:hypothetical protein
MPLVSLSDLELHRLLAAAKPLPPDWRDAFLQDVATMLAAMGEGAVHRAIESVERCYRDGARRPVEAMTRRGRGMLFKPTVELSEQELILYGEVSKAWGDRDLICRDNVVALVKQIAGPERQHMAEKVMAFIDEVQFVGSQVRGNG